MNYAKLFKKRADGRYIGNYKDAAGKWHSLSDKDPEQLFRKIEDAKKPRPITFKDAAVAWEKEYRESCNPRTWNNYRPHYESIVEKHGDMPVADIQGIDIIQDLQRAKAQGYSRTIVNTRRVIYNSILNYSVAQGWIPFNVATGIKLPKGLPSSKRSAPNDAIINIIIQNYKQPFGMFAFLCLCTGLRKGEALALLRSDIKDGEISVTKSLTFADGTRAKVKEPKSEAGKRTVPILSILAQPLDEYMAQLDGEILFPNRSYNGSPGNTYMTQSNYDTAWANYCKAVGIDGLTAHQLRHGTATLLFEAGVDVYTAKKMLGHSKVTTTMEIYTELREKKEQKSINKLNDYLLAISGQRDSQSNA
jgi:integrase